MLARTRDRHPIGETRGRPVIFGTAIRHHRVAREERAVDGYGVAVRIQCDIAVVQEDRDHIVVFLPDKLRIFFRTDNVLKGDAVEPLGKLEGDVQPHRVVSGKSASQLVAERVPWATPIGGGVVQVAGRKSIAYVARGEDRTVPDT